MTKKTLKSMNIGREATNVNLSQDPSTRDCSMRFEIPNPTRRTTIRHIPRPTNMELVKARGRSRDSIGFAASSSGIPRGEFASPLASLFQRGTKLRVEAAGDPILECGRE